ncbi:MAG TPA: hypothetical protein VGI70_03940, partial [Polyangiales bacterium]
MSSDLHRECERAVPLFGDAFVRSWLACALAAISCGPAQSRSLPNADQAGAPASVAGSFAGAVSVAGVSGSNGVIAGTSGVAGIAGHSVAGSSAGTAGASGSIAGADAGVATLPTSAADGGMSAGAGGASGSLDSAGVSASAGAGDVAGSAAVSGMSSCAASKPNDRPFGCAFAWGTDDSGGSLSGLSDLQFVSKWVGYEVDASGNLPSCDGCSWLTSEVKSTALVPVYYAYFIGYFGHANGLMDGNQNPNGPNL